MGSRNSPGQDAARLVSNGVVLQSLLQQGLECVQRGSCEEGLAFFAQAREQLTAQQVHLVPLLERAMRGFAAYCQARKAYLQAKERFARAESEQQALLNTFNALLSTTEGARASTCSHQIQPGVWPQPGPLLQGSRPHQLPVSSPVSERDTLPDLYITCFGRFQVYRDHRPLVLCRNRNGQAILRYLVAQSDHCATVDKLMVIQWPDDEQDVARHKVHVAVSALRSSLNSGVVCKPGGGYLLSENRTYRINPAASLKTDVDEFLALYQAGRRADGQEMAALYESACHLYVGPFLVEDRYADWSLIRCEQLSQIYLTMCRALADYSLSIQRYEDAMKWANTILSENQCDEAAYRQLMLAYAAQGNSNEALRQYRRCEQALRDELGVSPMPETFDVFQAILMSKQTSSSSRQ